MVNAELAPPAVNRNGLGPWIVNGTVSGTGSGQDGIGIPVHLTGCLSVESVKSVVQSLRSLRFRRERLLHVAPDEPGSRSVGFHLLCGSSRHKLTFGSHFRATFDAVRDGTHGTGKRQQERIQAQERCL